MKKEVLVASLLIAAIIVSGCTQHEVPLKDEGSYGQQDSGDLEASAYDQIEQEMEGATEDIDLGDLENELLL